MPKRAIAGESPLVSILINSYNYLRFLDEAIASAVAQDYPRIEIVVVDDGSTDGSRELIASYGGRLKAVYQANGGQAASFNAGFAASTGEIICLLDADDRFRASKVSAIVAEYRQHPLIEWCFHPMALFGERVAEPPIGQFRTGVEVDVRAEMRSGKLRLTAPATSGLTFRRALLTRLMPMPTEIRITSDNYLKFAALGTAIGMFSDKTLAEQRIHGSNAYTLRSHADARRGAVAILTARHIADRFPELLPFADGHFTRGLGVSIAERGFVALCDVDAAGYLAGRSPTTRARLVTRALVRSALTKLVG